MQIVNVQNIGSWMKQEYIIREDGNRGVVLMFGGWGSGPELFGCYAVPAGYDFILCYDYREMDFDYSILDGYSKVRLVAWSMGVWAAGHVFGSGKDARNALAGSPVWESRIAIGGTPFPIDDSMGIPVNIFAGTLENLSEITLAKFRRRMCGPEMGHFMEHLPGRGLDELRDELDSIGKAVAACPCDSGFGWDMAVIGGSDMIFPPQNQKNAWENLGVELHEAEDARHYEPSIFKFVLSLPADVVAGGDGWIREK